MITAVVTSDNHLGAYYARMRPDNLDRRRRHLQEGFKRVVDAAITRRVDMFLHAGDLFDRPDPRNSDRKFAAEQFQRLRDAGIAIYAIAGNHDSPRSYGYDGRIAPLEELNAVQAIRLFRGVDVWEADTPIIRGHRICIRGLSSDPNCLPDSCPLQDLASDYQRGGDIDIVLLHYGVEQWGAFEREPWLTLANLDRLGTDAVCVGHLHKRNQRRLPGGSIVINPGATEHIHFGEEKLECGFWLLTCEPGRVETEYVCLSTQPMQTLDLDLDVLSVEAAEVNEREVTCIDIDSELDELLGLPVRGNTIRDQGISSAFSVLLRQRIEAVSRTEQLLRVRLSGRLKRDALHDLDIAALQECGQKANFYFQLETEGLALFDELEGRLFDVGFNFDVREELEKAVNGLLPIYADDPTQRQIHIEAGQMLLGAYDRKIGGGK